MFEYNVTQTYIYIYRPLLKQSETMRYACVHPLCPCVSACLFCCCSWGEPCVCVCACTGVRSSVRQDGWRVPRKEKNLSLDSLPFFFVAVRWCFFAQASLLLLLLLMVSNARIARVDQPTTRLWKGVSANKKTDNCNGRMTTTT